MADRQQLEKWIENLLVAQALVEDIPDKRWVPGSRSA